MKYLHYVTNQEGEIIESVYSANNNPKFSMECWANINKGTYQIYDRESHKITIIELSIN